MHDSQNGEERTEEVDDAHNDKNTLEEQSDNGNQDRTDDTFFLSVSCLFSRSIPYSMYTHSRSTFLQNAYENASCEKREKTKTGETMRVMVLMMVMTKTTVVTLEALFVNRC